MPAIHLLAPAKVNLSMEVLGRRSDGYHEVRTVLQAIDLCDELEIGEAEDLSLSVEPQGAAPVEGNLVLLAAERLRAAYGVQAGAAITLRKRIPAGAGLGGGSSDAAAALLGLCRLWGIRPPLEELAEIAAALGSDVPFFLRGGTALGEGRGELLSPLLPPAERFAVLLALQEANDAAKTRRLYGLLRQEHFSDGAPTTALMDRLRAGKPVAESMTNTFELVAEQAFTGYSAARAAFIAAGAGKVLLSGAGPSLFALVNEEGVAGKVRDRLAKASYEAPVVRLLPAWSEGGYQGM